MCFSVEKYRPSKIVNNIADINLNELDCDGILVDLDNTLLPWKNNVAPESTYKWISEAKALGKKICIVSNTHSPARLNKVADDLGVMAVAKAMKPGTKAFENAASMISCDINRCIVIGDQLLTDILGGNKVGCKTILVRPMDKKEFFGTKLSRLIEKIIFARLSIKDYNWNN